MEQIERKNLIFRRISYLDFVEFKKAGIESVSTNEAFLGFGHIFKNISVLDYMLFFSEMLKDKGAEGYGLFHRNTLLGFSEFSFGFSPFGTELIGWVRNGYQNLGLGELGLNTAAVVAFEGKKFNYVQLKIDSSNGPSRRLAEKAGFKPCFRATYSAGSEATYIYYLKINPKVEALANRYGRRALDIINSPASSPGLNFYLKSSSVAEFYEWPFADFDEDSKPVSASLLSSYLALININSADFER